MKPKKSATSPQASAVEVVKKLSAPGKPHPHRNLGEYLHPAKKKKR